MDGNDEMLLAIIDSSLKWGQCESRCELARVLSVEFTRLIPSGVCVEVKEERANRTQEPQKPALKTHLTRLLNSEAEIFCSLGTLKISFRFTLASDCRYVLTFLSEAKPLMESAYEKTSIIEDLTREFHSPSHSRSSGTKQKINAETFTKRENQIYKLLTRGLSNGEISHNLAITRRTVEKHLQSILSKLGLENRYQAIALQIIDES